MSETSEKSCPCGSGQPYVTCCAPYHKGEAFPPTAAELMRSRYAAFAVSDIDYLKETTAPERRSAFVPREVERWNRSVTWKGLEILDTVAGGPDDATGEVTFIARFERHGAPGEVREHSRFNRENGKWRYVDGDVEQPEKQAPSRREAPKVGRNDPCPCGSGKKFKKCCG